MNKPVTLLMLSLFCFHFACGQKLVADKIVAIVGEKIILQSDLDRLLSDDPQALPSAINTWHVFEQVLQQKLLLCGAERAKLRVADSTLRDSVDARVSYLLDDYGGENVVQRLTRLTISQLRSLFSESMREHMLEAAMEKSIRDAVTITPSDLRAYVETAKDTTLEEQVRVAMFDLPVSASAESELATQQRLENDKLAWADRNGGGAINNYDDLEDGGSWVIYTADSTRIDTAVLNQVKRLEPRMLSPVFRMQLGYYCVLQMLERQENGWLVNALVYRSTVAEPDIALVRQRIDSVRSAMQHNGFFPVAAMLGKDSGSCLLQTTGRTLLTRDDVMALTGLTDAYFVGTVDSLRPGQLSAPQEAWDNKGMKIVRLVYLQQRVPAHRVTLDTDADFLARMALAQKQDAAVAEWFRREGACYYLLLDRQALPYIDGRQWAGKTALPMKSWHK